MSEVMNSLSEAEAWERVKSFPSLFLIFPASDFWIHAVPFIGKELRIATILTSALRDLCEHEKGLGGVYSLSEVTGETIVFFCLLGQAEGR